MANPQRVRAGMIGVGQMARNAYLPKLYDAHAHTELVAICEPSEEMVAAAQAKIAELGGQPVPNEPDVERFLAHYADRLDAVFILTPHKFHHDQAKAALEAGLDVLLEKPMVMNAGEAQSLIEARDRMGKHLVVAFQGSLSPQIRTAVQMKRAGELGELRSISATIWQNWNDLSDNTWRMVPEISGGGFMFDSGAHMLNTVADLADEEFVEVAAWLDPRGRPVDILGTVMARLASGALVTMHGCGDTIPTVKSDIHAFFTEAVLITGAWGEQLKLQRRGHKTFHNVEVPPSTGPWETFLQVRAGQIPNPSPAEVGLRMARLWDAIRASAAQGGTAVSVER